MNTLIVVILQLNGWVYVRNADAEDASFFKFLTHITTQHADPDGPQLPDLVVSSLLVGPSLILMFRSDAA